MLGESVTLSFKGQTSPVQLMAPAGREMAQKGGTDVKAGKLPDSAQTTQIVADAKKNLDMIHDTDLQFSVHEASGKVMITVKNEESGEIVREIPPEEVLNLAAKLDAMIGRIFDQHV